MSEQPSSNSLLKRAKAAIDLGGPPPPWQAVGITSIRFPEGTEMHCQSNGGHINAWTRERICEAINLLPLLVAELERLALEPSAERERLLRIAEEVEDNGLPASGEQLRQIAARIAVPPTVHRFKIGDTATLCGYPVEIVGFIERYQVRHSGKNGWRAVDGDNLLPPETKSVSMDEINARYAGRERGDDYGEIDPRRPDETNATLCTSCGYPWPKDCVCKDH